MIRILFRKYRFQIFLAFALVIVENVTFIAEPYVFGQAIDDLRETNRIENEVDSSVTNTIIQQAIDSVRDYILDSLSLTMPEDSLQSYRSNSDKNIPDQLVIIPALFTASHQHQSSQTSHKKHPRRDSLKQKLDKSIENIKRADTSVEAQTELLMHPPQGHLQQRVRKVLNKRDSIHKLVKSGNISLNRKKILNRDSLRTAIEKKPHTHRQVIGKGKKKENVGFSLPKDLVPFLPPLIPWIILFVVSSCVGGIRRVYDTRIYTRMFADLSGEVVAQQLEQGEDLSKIAGRSSLA